jgi:hypothetical protein
VNLELVQAVALEDRPADADHPFLELIDRKGPALGWQPGSQIDHERSGSGESSDQHKSAATKLNVRGKR